MIPCNEKTHTDTMDASFEISLHEYGVVRNPVTGDTVFCLNPSENHEMTEDREYSYSNFQISIEDAKEALENAEDGFFSFIGSDRDHEIKSLENDDLTYIIYSLNQYNGCFDPNLF